MTRDEPMSANPKNLRITVERLGHLKKVSGKSLTEALQAGDEERLRAQAFLVLYARDMEAGLLIDPGYRPDPDDVWDRAAQVEILLGDEEEPERLGPTNGAPSKTSLSSAVTGV